MDFILDPPWPWSLSPVEALQHAVYMPAFIARILIGLLVWLIVGLATRRGNPLAGAPVLGMAMVGGLLAGQPLPLLAAVLVIYLTVATYRPAAGARRSTARMLVVLSLRLLALLLTMVTLTRPALLVRSEDKVPSVLIILPDISKSMTIKDEYNNQSRWDAMTAALKRCEPLLRKLQVENQITTVMFGFADRVVDWDAKLQPDGPSTDIGGALAELYQRFGNEPNLRGIVLISDGADNGRRFNAIAEARKWRTVRCPIDAFAVGQPLGNRDKDIAITSLSVEPAPVYIKGRMTFRATVDATGFENAGITPTVRVEGGKDLFPEKILVNGVDTTEPILNRSAGNELRIEMTAPETPGEYKMTLKIKPLPGEASVANNEVSTFVTVSKEGVSVLLVAPADEETKYIRDALKADPRVRLFEATRQSEEPPGGDEAEKFNFNKQAYDVIILRNVSSRRLSGGNPALLEKIRKMVVEGGTGLMMMGGFDSFGGSEESNSVGNWTNTPIGQLLPVDLSVSGHISSGRELPRVGLYPTDEGARHYLLQLGGDSKKTWDRLNAAIDLRGANRLGKNKVGTSLLARAGTDDSSPPMMVAHSPGKGRVLALAGDTTYLWRIFGLPDTTEGVDIHARFWKQTVLWLAHQENAEGAVWVKPDFRRLPAGQQQGFAVGARGKSGVPLPDGKFAARVVAPDGKDFAVPVRREGEADRGAFWQTLQPGEYRLEVEGKAIDLDGKPVEGKSSVRFLVYEDERELLQTAADIDFLGKLAAAAGGRANPYRADDLEEFLKKLQSASLPSEKVKVERYPDWRNIRLTPFLPLWLILFTIVLCTEWALRRLWGMV